MSFSKTSVFHKSPAGFRMLYEEDETFIAEYD